GLFENAVPSGSSISDVIDLDMDGRRDLFYAGFTSTYVYITYNTTIHRISVNRDPSGVRFGWPNALGTNFQVQTTAEKFVTYCRSHFQLPLFINSNPSSFLIHATNAKSFIMLKIIR